MANFCGFSASVFDFTPNVDILDINKFYKIILEFKY